MDCCNMLLNCFGKKMFSSLIFYNTCKLQTSDVLITYYKINIIYLIITYNDKRKGKRNNKCEGDTK